MSLAEERYGKRSTRRWPLILVAVLGIGAGVGWAAWVAFQPKPVSAVLYGYDVTSDRSITLTLEIHRPDPIAVECEVYAQAEDHSVVGERTVSIAASEEETVREKVVVETVRRAVTGVLRTCQPAE